MAALHYATSVLFCIGATAATYLSMHLWVAPRLPVAFVEVPPLSGLSVEQASALCDPRGLLLVIDGERTPDPGTSRDRPIVPGTLFDQHPMPGSRLHPGEKVHVSIARAAPRVPNLAGQSPEAARKLLGEAGLLAGTVREVFSATVPPGQVVGSQPEAGAEARPGDGVDLEVSKGPEQVAVPRLLGRGARAARQALEQAGLVLGEQKQGVDDNAEDGVVLRQTPAAGTMVPKGQKVDVVVNE